MDASSPDAAAIVRELTRGGVDYAFEALGRPATIELALSLTARGGQAILIGMAPPDARIPLDALTMTIEERGVRGCWYGSCLPARDFPLLLDLYRSGRLRLDPLITECGLDDVNEALRKIEAGEHRRAR